MTEKHGTIQSMSDMEYHAHPYIGSTDCKNILSTPRLYKYMKENPPEQSLPMAFGSAAHCYLLEPKKFQNSYYVSESDDKRTSQFKEDKEIAESQGKIPLKKSEYTDIVMMAAEVSKCKLAALLMKMGRYEEAHFAEDPETGARAKAKLDFIGEHESFGSYIIDYKTTRVDLSRQSYTRQFANLKAHIQVAHYMRVVELTTGKRPETFFHLVQMSQAPFLCRMFRIPSEWIDDGDSLRYKAWDTIAQCEKNGIFYGYENETYTDLGEIPAFVQHGEEG